MNVDPLSRHSNPVRTNENYLRWQLGRWARQNAPTITVLDPQDRSIALQPAETVIARISLDAPGSPLIVTDQRLVLSPDVSVWYADVEHCVWIDRDPDSKGMRKQTHFGRMVLEMAGGKEVVLEGLGQAVFPLLSFFHKKLHRYGGRVAG